MQEASQNEVSGLGLPLIRSMQKLSLQHKSKCNSALLTLSVGFYFIFFFLSLAPSRGGEPSSVPTDKVS